MKCPGCNQELSDNQACQTCHPAAQATQPETNPQPGATGATTSQPPPDGSASPPPDATGVPQPTPLPADGPPTLDPERGKSSSTSMIDVWKSQITAGGNVTLQNLIVEDKEHKPEEEKSLQDFVRQLTSRKGRHYRLPEAELQKMIERLMDDRLILISSSFDEYALDTAWTVVEELRLSATRAEGQLTFEDAAAASVEFSLPKLCEQRPDTDTETVLIVQALHNHADTFPASILGNSAKVGSARHDLKNCKLFVIVVVNHEYAISNSLSQQQNLPYRTFKYWNIPFLEPFLQSSFPAHHEQLLAEIAKQRNKWEADELAFTKQILSYYANDRLRDVINSGGPHDPDTAAKSMLETASPVNKTVLYAATFFSEITLPEFCRVVESLLGTRTMLKDAPTNGNGTPAQIEVSLRGLWDKEKDSIFTDLLVETTTDSPRTVNLAEVNLAEPLRKLFEKRHRFYLLDQFNALLHTGIFFYPSLRLAQNTTEIAVELAQLYPDEFNESWIVYLVTRIREYFAAGAANENEVDDPMFRFLSSRQPGSSNLAFARVSEVCQRFLGTPQQKDVVSNTLEHLMRTRYYMEVFWLIKQLKFNTDFDDWYWLKQLLNRADLKTKYFTYYYMLAYLKQMGTRVYEGLRKIETWLPADDRSNDNNFDTFVFRVLIEYCLDTIDRFKEKNYGKWPSRYPLFNVPDAKTAGANCSLLAHWLLHPGVDRTLANLKIIGTRITLLAILLAEWTFILLGTPPVPKTDAGETKKKELTPGTSEDFSASQLFDLLIEEFLTRLDLTERLELLKYWTHLQSELFKSSRQYSLSDKERQEASWKEVVMQKLIGKLKTIPTTKPLLKKLPAATGSRV